MSQAFCIRQRQPSHTKVSLVGCQSHKQDFMCFILYFVPLDSITFEISQRTNSITILSAQTIVGPRPSPDSRDKSPVALHLPASPKRAKVPGGRIQFPAYSIIMGLIIRDGMLSGRDSGV